MLRNSRATRFLSALCHTIPARRSRAAERVNSPERCGGVVGHFSSSCFGLNDSRAASNWLVVPFHSSRGSVGAVAVHQGDDGSGERVGGSASSKMSPTLAR